MIFIYSKLFFVFWYLGEPYFEKQKPYPRYYRSPKKRLQRNEYETSSENLLTEIISNNDHTYQYLKRRAKRQLDFDPTAKHVEVLVAYDESIKEFHSNADIKSYILTLFSYVRFVFCKRKRYLILTFRCHIYILMRVLVIILKYGLLN